MKQLLTGILALALSVGAIAQPTPAGGSVAATQAEVDAGVIANKWVSPLTLKNAATAGDVTGPAASTDNAVPLFDSTTGRLLKNSVTILNPTTGAISGFTTGTGLTFHGGGALTGASNALNVSATSLTLTSALNAVNVPSGITPSVEWEVDSTSTSSPRGIMTAQFNSGTDGARFHMRKARGTRASPTVVVTGDNLGRLVASGYDGASYLEMGSIIFTTTGTIGTNRIPTKITFLTATDAAPSVLTTALELDQSQGATFASSVASTAGGFTASAGSAFLWSSRASIQSPNNGQINITVANQGTGVGIDANTDGTLRVRNRAQNADAALTASNATLSGVYIGSTQALSGAGAANVTTETTKITSTGVLNAITLADGVDGQTKIVLHDVDGGSFVLTPTTKTGWSTFTSTVVGESITLKFVTTRGWIVVGSYLGTIAP